MASGVANVNAPLLLTLRSSPPLSCNTTVPDSPDTDPANRIRARRLPPAQLSAVAVSKVMMPGAPPVSVVSVTAIRVVPSCWKEIVEPTALRVSLVPAGSGPLL